MDDYVVGQTYTFNGVPYVFGGGDPKKRASWSTPSAPVDPEQAARDAAQTRMSNSGESPLGGALRDFGALALNAGTLGWADEAMNAIRPGSGDKLHQRVEDARLLNPKTATLAAEGAGAILPGMLGLGASGSMAATGAVEGGLMGMGDAEPGGGVAGAAKAAAIPAALGAGIGLAADVAPAIGNAIARSGPARGERLAGAIRTASGVTRKITDAIRETRAAMKRVSTDLYRPLDKQFAKGVNDQGIMEFINSSPDFVAAARSVSRELIPYTSELSAGTSRAARGPTVSELQSIRDILARKGNREAHAQLTDLMEKAIPGYAEANAQYAAQAAIRSARVAGRKMFNASAADIQLAREGLGGAPQVLDAFQEGQVHEATRRLLTRRGGTAGPVKQLLDMGPEYRDKMVQGVFGGDEAKFAQFEKVLQKERSAEKVAAALHRLAPWAAGGIGIGIGGKVAGAVMDRLAGQ